MQRKKLEKAIRKFSHKTNFYKLGLVRRYLLYQEKSMKDLQNAIPNVVCPSCGSHRISVESDDREYCDDTWLYCEKCGECFDDTFGYIEAVSDLKFEPWGDMIAIKLHFENPDIKSEKWKQFCEDEILKTLGLKTDDSVNIF